jgi:hypothetical protein
MFCGTTRDHRKQSNRMGKRSPISHQFPNGFVYRPLLQMPENDGPAEEFRQVEDLPVSQAGLHGVLVVRAVAGKREVDYEPVARESRPARVGFKVVRTEPPCRPPPSPLSVTTSAASAIISGVVAPVVFSGAAPPYPGVCQVNVQIPNTGLRRQFALSILQRAAESVRRIHLWSITRSAGPSAVRPGGFYRVPERRRKPLAWRPWERYPVYCLSPFG